MIKRLSITVLALILCAGCAKTDGPVKASKKVYWSISIADVERFDMNGDDKLTPAELAASVNEKTVPVAMEFLSTRIPPGRYATKADLRKAMELSMAPLSRQYAMGLLIPIDANSDGQLSREEVSAVEGKQWPIDLELTYSEK